MKKSAQAFLLGLFVLGAGGAVLLWPPVNVQREPKALTASSASRLLDPLQIVLTPQVGDSVLDKQIRDLQAKVQAGTNRNAFLERLGWSFVAKARLTSDPGFYSLAEQAANAIAATTPDDPSVHLLRGHVRHAQHRFAEAEEMARVLVGRRESSFDFALLGDALMEQGKLGEAVDAYQKMMDLKPCLQSYSRVAHMRWLKGDLRGAIEAIRLAVSAGNPREPEPTSWAYTRLALYQLQAGEFEPARISTDAALQVAPDYAPALLMKGRVLLSQGKSDEAVEPLHQAAAISPLPEYFWILAEALRANGNAAEADQAAAQLVATGPSADPRTTAIFVASSGQNAPLALQLASAELASRQDIFTHDAMAWAQFANGDIEGARASSRLALAEGTQDARLFYHAGVIAAAAGANAEALEFFNKAHPFEQMLFPSERKALGLQTAALIGAAAQISIN